MDRHGKRQGIASQQASEPVERPTPCPPTPQQPLPPKTQDLIAKSGDREAVPRDPVISIVASQFLAQYGAAGTHTSSRRSPARRSAPAAVPSQRSRFARSAAERCRGRSSGVGHPVSPAGLLSMETTGSPTFLGNPDCALALFSDPGRTDGIRPVSMPRHGPHSVHGKGSCIYSFRGSITRLRHWLSTLRRPGHPDTTQDSLPVAGQALPDGLGYPWGSNERFRGVSYISASFPKFNAAQGRS